MDHGEPILDYASPRKRSGLRLPAKSIVVWFKDENEITIRERLAADPGTAITGLIVAAATFLGSIAVLVTDGVFDHVTRKHLDSLLCPAIPLLMEIVVALMVIQQTWRRTVLIVGQDRLNLMFLSPFRNRRYFWTGNDIASVSMSVTANEQTPSALAEMLIIRVVGSPVQLFTDHPAADVAAITGEIQSYLQNGRALSADSQ